jgi:hypothetical protein
MTAPGRPDDLQQLLEEELVAALERGHWRVILYGRRAAEMRAASSGSVPSTNFVVLLVLVARAQEALAMGRFAEAGERLAEACGMLPDTLTYVDRETGALRARRALVARPGHPQLTARVGCVVWREQTGLDELQTRFGGDRARAREVLVEACVQYLTRVEHDDCAIYPLAADPDLVGRDPTSVDRSRKDLLGWATRLRQFANPGEGEVTPPVWQDIGKWRGLRAAANLSLGQCPNPATSRPDVPVPDAWYAAWRAARRWMRASGLLAIALIR